MRILAGALAGVVVVVVASAAQAQTSVCVPPGPPPSESLRPTKVGPKPPLPACANPDTGRSTCRKSEADRYNAAISAYNLEVTIWNRAAAGYVDALNDWTRAAGRYSQCEIDQMDLEIPR